MKNKHDHSSKPVAALYDIADCYRLMPMPSPRNTKHDYVDVDAVQALLSGTISRKAALVAKHRAESLSRNQSRRMHLEGSTASDDQDSPLGFPSTSSPGNAGSPLWEADLEVDHEIVSVDGFAVINLKKKEPDEGQARSAPLRPVSRSLPTYWETGYEIPIELRGRVPNASSTDPPRPHDDSGLSHATRRDRALAFSISEYDYKQSTRDGTCAPTSALGGHAGARPGSTSSLPDSLGSVAYMVVPISSFCLPTADASSPISARPRKPSPPISFVPAENFAYAVSPVQTTQAPKPF